MPYMLMMLVQLNLGLRPQPEKPQRSLVATAAPSEVPRWLRFRVAPETETTLAGVDFRSGVLPSLGSTLLTLVLLVVPGQTEPNLLEPDIRSAHFDDPHYSSVAV